MGCPFSSDIGRRLLLLLQSNKQGVVQTGETFRAALTYCASDTELTPCRSILNFSKIKLEKSGLTNWIFSLFHTGFLLLV